MAPGIEVSDERTLEDIKKEFNQKYPYIRISIYRPEEKSKSNKLPLDPRKSIGMVRTRMAPGTITITGNKHVKTLEREFDEIFGLYVEVCYTTADGKRCYTMENVDKTTLASFNRKCQADGCQKGVWL